MAVQVPPEVNWLFDILCTQSWPEGDEDALRRCAQAWQEAARALGDLAGYLDSSAEHVLASADSMSADDYDHFWKTYIHDGDGTYVDLFKQCEPLVKQLFAQATEVEYTKIVIVVTLILTAIQIAIAIAAAAGTFGGSLAEVGLAMFIGRQTILMVVARFVEMALMMLIPDLVAQTVMFAQGHGWDWSKTGAAFENALVAGTIAAALGPLAGKLPWMSEEAAQTIGGKAGALATHIVEGGAVNDLTALTTMGANYGVASLTGNKDWQQQIAQQWSSTNWVALFAQGGVLAGAFYTPHMFGHDGVPMTFTGSDGKSYTVYLNDAALTSLRGAGHLPLDYQARVFGENGVKVGDATFDGATISFDKPINGQSGADLGAGFTVATHDGSQFRFQPSDQAGPDGQPHFDLVSRVQKSADPITVPTADPGGDPLKFPPGSVVHYDNVPGPDGTMTGQPYRVEVTEGNVVKIYQAQQPGGPFELTGQVVHSSGTLRFFGADAPKYYGPEGQGDGAQPLATVSLATGKTTTNDLPGYLSAHLDRWGPGAPTSPAGAAGPRIVDSAVVTPAHDGTAPTPANDGSAMTPADGGQRAAQEAQTAEAVGVADANAFAYAQQVQQILQNHPELFIDLRDSMRGGPPPSPVTEEDAWPQLYRTGDHQIPLPRDLADLAESGVATRLTENRTAYEAERQAREDQYRQYIKGLEDTRTSPHTLRLLDQERQARTEEYLQAVHEMAVRYEARDRDILIKELTQMQRVRLAGPEARINRALRDLHSEYEGQLREIDARLADELAARRHMDLDRLYVPQLERLDAEWVRAEGLPGPERLERFSELSRQLRDLEVGMYRQHEALRIGPDASAARRWVRDLLNRALKDSKVNGVEQPDKARTDVIGQIATRVERLQQPAARTPAEGQVRLTAETAELRKIAVELSGGAGQARPEPLGPVTRWAVTRVEADTAVAAAVDHVLAGLPAEGAGGGSRVHAAYELVGFGVPDPGPTPVNSGKAVPGEPSRWVDNAAGGLLNYVQLRAGVPGDLRVGSLADRRTDAEFQIVAQVRARLTSIRARGTEPVGVVVIGADKLMCPSCQMALHELMGDFPGINVVLASGTVTVILDPGMADVRSLSDVYGPSYDLRAEVVPLDASAAVDMGQVAEGAKFFEPATLRDDVPPELDLGAFARHQDGLAEAAPDTPEFRGDYEMITKIRHALAERARATEKTQAVVLDGAGQPHWVEGGPYGFARTPGKFMAWADGIPEADYPQPVRVANPPDLRAALNAPGDRAALSDLAAQLRARAADTGRVQAIVRDETGQLRWVEGGRIGILSLPEPTLGPGRPILLADDPHQRIVAQTEWADVNPADVARRFPPEQFSDRLVIPPTGDAIRLTPVAREDTAETGPQASGPDHIVSRSMADVLNQSPHPVAATDGHSEVPSGFSRIDLPAGLDRLAGLVHKMPDRVAGYAGSDEKLIELVRQVTGVKGAFLVDMHGDAAGPWDPSNPRDRLSVTDLHALLEAAGWNADTKQPVVLMSCDAAQRTYAADLAAELGVKVIAPTARVWQVGDRVFVYEVNPETGLPDWSKPGHWEEFGGKNPGPVAVDEHGMPVLDAPHPDARAADARQAMIALGPRSDPQAHAPPVSRGEDGTGDVPPSQRPLRILAFITMWDPNAGGVVAVNRQLCEALAAEGHDVYVRVGHPPPDVRIDGIHLIGPRVFDPGTDSRYQLVGDYENLPGQVDSVIGHSRFSGPAARQVRDEVYPAAQLVHFVHMAPEALGRVQLKPPDVVEGNVAIERDLVTHADLAVGVGPRLAEEVRSLARQGSADGHMPVIHELTPGVEIVDRQPHTGQDPLKIVYLLGRADDAQKGAIQAAEMVRSLGPENARLVVRGVPSDLVEAERQRLSDIAGGPVQVRPFTIDHAELVSDLQEADVLIMPSRAEGFGLVALEAAGAGVPVLVPSTSGAGMFFADPARFPADLTEHSLVEQGFEEPVPVARWTDQLKAILDDMPGAQQRALDIQQRLRDADVTWRAAGRSLVDEIRQLQPRPDPAPQRRQSIVDALRVEIVRPGEHSQAAGGPVTHEPPPQFATITRVVREADHLLVEINDGQRSVRVDVNMAARRAVVSSLDPNGAWLRDMAGRAQTPDGMFDLFGHADEYGFVVDGLHVPFRDLARYLPELPEDTKIRLCGCETGRGEAVVELAVATQRVVRVTDKPVFEDTQGNVFACTAQEGADGLIRLVPDRNGQADGMWADVYPDGHRDNPVQDGFPVTSVLADGDIVLRLAPGDYFRDVTIFGPGTRADLRLPPQVRDFAGDSGYPGPPGSLVARDGVAYDQDRLAAVNVRLMGFAEDAIGDGARWIRIYFDGDPRVRGSYRSVLDAIAASRAERLAARAEYQRQGLSRSGSAAELRGEGPDIREPGHFIAEVAVMHDNVYLGADGQNWGRAPFELERVKLHGIPVEAQYLWGRDAAQMVVKSFPDREGGYPEIARRLEGYRATYSSGNPRRAAEFGQRYADAMLELVRGDRAPAADGYPDLLQQLSRGNAGAQAFAEITRIGLQDAHCLPLHELAMDTFGLPKYMEFYRRIMEPRPVEAFRETEVGRFLQEAASLTVLNIGLEGARHPENFFTGLMTWHLVADGLVSIDDALGHFNVMGPQGAGLISRWADWLNGWTYDGHPGSRAGWSADQPAKYINGIPEPPDSLPAAAEEMRRREREIVALYAQSRDQDLLGPLNQAFFGTGLPGDPQLRERLQMDALRGLIDYLFTHDMRWPPSLELFRPPQEN